MIHNFFILFFIIFNHFSLFGMNFKGDISSEYQLYQYLTYQLEVISKIENDPFSCYLSNVTEKTNILLISEKNKKYTVVIKGEIKGCITSESVIRPVSNLYNEFVSRCIAPFLSSKLELKTIIAQQDKNIQISMYLKKDYKEQKDLLINNKIKDFLQAFIYNDNVEFDHKKYLELTKKLVENKKRDVN